MRNERFIAYALIAIGGIALLSRVSGSAGWLWIGLVAFGFLFAYTNQRNYGYLVTGCILAGIAIGLLLERSWQWNGSFLVSLGIGFLIIDQVERKSNRWPLYLGGLLIALGLLSGLFEAGILTTWWFAVLLIVVGGYLLTRKPTAERLEEREAAAPFIPPPDDGAAPEASPAAGNEAVAAPTPSPAVAEESVNSSPDTVETPLDGSIQVRLEALQNWRRATAAAEQRAVFLVFTNETLRLLAEKNPQTREDLKSIKGIGPVKLERYGPHVLEVLHGLTHQLDSTGEPPGNTTS